MPTPRMSPSFVVAVLALVVASGGAGYAAGRITSADIKDGTIQSRDIGTNQVRSADVDNGSLRGEDLRPGSIPRSRLDRSCGNGQAEAFGGCVPLAAVGPSSHQAAIDHCNRRGGRLPTTLELRWIATHDEYAWADGNPSQYEFSADYTDPFPSTPIAFDRNGNSVPNASAQLFWHHCVLS